MKWVDSLIANKLTVYLLAIALCLLGIFCLFFIIVSPFPAIPGNALNIHLVYPGANAATVQTQVTTKVENALKGIPNVQRISATTLNHVANIELDLDSSQPNDLLQTQVKVLQAISASNLPSTVPQPVITLGGGVAGLCGYVLTSDKLSLFQIDNFLHAKLMPKFMAIPGVTIDTSNQDPVVHIRLIPAKLAQYKININNLANQLNKAFSASPLGNLYLSKHAYLLGLSDPIDSLQDFKQLIVGYQNQLSGIGNPIYLQDIATISFAPRSLLPTSYSSYNGRVSEGVNLYTTTDANPFKVYKQTQHDVAQISANLPADLKISLSFTMVKTMHDSFTEVVVTILIASILVLLVALIFLGRFRITLVPIVTIPVCLLGAVIVMTCLGFSLNILTLLAMVVAVGLVVDDSIVVVENITRHLESGMKRHEAIVHGTADIARTIIGITATLLAVYLPITFCSGPFIIMLKAFAVPLSAAVFISGIAALTLTPVMAASLISTAPPNNYQRKFNQFLKSVIAAYHKVLKLVLSFPYFSLAIIIALIVSGIYFDIKIPRGFFPADPNARVTITAQATPQDTIVTLNKKFNLLASFYHNKYVHDYTTEIDQDTSTGQITGRLQIHYYEKYLHQNKQFADDINAYIQSHHIPNMVASMDKFLTWGRGSDVNFTIYGGDSAAQINQKARLLTDDMKKSAIFSHVSNTINLPHKQLAFTINNVLAAKFGIYRSDITSLLAAYYGGVQLNNYFNIVGLSVPVVLQLNKKSVQNPASLQQLQIYSPTTQSYYPFNKFVSLKMVAKPTVISTMNGEPSVEIDANLNKGYALSDAIPYINSLIAAKASSTAYQYQGNAKTYLQGNNQTLIVGGLGIICIYMLLAILFSSLADPFIILLTVPFSVVSGAFSLYLFGETLNLYSILALITLIGLITKHGVLIVQFANEELKKGSTVVAAVLAATHDRFRPIIMTTLAMTLGALPLLLSQGFMYVARRDLSMVLISGLIVGTIFSLLIVPLVYTLIKKAEHVV